jgi:membrane-bound lytic murein transglycosylase D
VFLANPLKKIVMNKLLLLATILVSFLLKDYAAATPLGKKPLSSGTAFSLGKLNPKAIAFIQDYMETEGDNLMALKVSGKRYFNIIETALEKRSLPTELKYLAVIESELKSGAVSVKGAGGPWQLMPETARNLGLRVNGKIDERRDYFKSTYAAARYLAYLYDLYEDWLLVIAAYNGGPGKVNTAIRRSGSRNFWQLQNYLPSESRKHVKKFIATHYIMEGEGGLTTLTKDETAKLLAGYANAPVVDDGSLAVQNISGKYYSKAIVDVLKMNIAEFDKLNPNFDKQLSARGHYDLRLPAVKMEQFKEVKPQILQQSVGMLLGTIKG